MCGRNSELTIIPWQRTQKQPHPHRVQAIEILLFSGLKRDFVVDLATAALRQRQTTRIAAYSLKTAARIARVQHGQRAAIIL